MAQLGASGRRATEMDAWERWVHVTVNRFRACKVVVWQSSMAQHGAAWRLGETGYMDLKCGSAARRWMLGSV
jgi:hypothetical protein